MLTFTNQWLAGPDREQLAASLSSFVGTDAYRLTELLTDLPLFHRPAEQRRRRATIWR